MSYLSRLSKKFPGKRAFITGAGSGLGFAFATDLSKAGWRLGITDVNRERLNEAAMKLTQVGSEPRLFEFDVADYSAFQSAVQIFIEEHGGIDIGINNAGIGCGGHIDEMKIEDFRRVIDVNLMGVVNGCHLFVPVMKRQCGGHILNVASAAAFVAAPRMSAYNTSKAGVLALSETLRAELINDGIGVSVLMPTYVRTNIGVDSLGSEQDNKLARLFVEASNLQPDVVAATTLARIAANELYVVMPREAITLWRFKRHLPNVFWKFISKEARKRTEIMSKRSI